MGRALRLEHQRSSAEIERGGVLDGDGGEDDFDSLERLIAQHGLVDGEIALGPRGQPARQLVMADIGGIVLLERRIAEHVVGMHVGIDHVADRLVGHGAERRF